MNPGDWSCTPERAADADRDLLALFATAQAGDEEGAKAILRNANLIGLLTAALGFMEEILRDHGADPAVWAAERQESLLRGDN